MWLGEAGLVSDDWVIDPLALQRLGMPVTADVVAWRSLTREQHETVQTLRIRALGNPLPIQSAELLDLLRQRGVEFEEAQVAKQIYAPLIKAGFITQDVKTGGRGAKGGTILLTDYGLNLDASLIDGLELGNVPPDLQRGLRRSTVEILADLNSSDTHTKGIALELLSLRMTADLGLLPAEMRLRSARTGGAEVDLVAEGAHLHFSRWLIQCKNQTQPVGIGVLAKEVGMATLLKAHVVVIVTTGKFASTVRDYARKAAEDTAFQVILLDGASLGSYRSGGSAALRSELRGCAQEILARKRPQLDEVPSE